MGLFYNQKEITYEKTAASMATANQHSNPISQKHLIGFSKKQLARIFKSLATSSVTGHSGEKHLLSNGLASAWFYQPNLTSPWITPIVQQINAPIELVHWEIALCAFHDIGGFA